MKKQKSVLIGLSGGVDSAVAALLLKRSGYKVKALFLKLFSKTKNPLTNECNWIEDYKSAQKIATILNIELIKADYESYYNKKILQPMFKAYKSGITPNPDILCNSLVKFPFLLKEAKKHNCNFIATGHYARIKKNKYGYHLLQSTDSKKDQSYFLADLNQKVLEKTLFPIGNLTKQEVRTIAKANRFSNWDRDSTAGVCFVGNIQMQSFLKQKIKEKPGKILTPKREIIGIHKGTSFYTIGQKVNNINSIQLTKPKDLAQKKLYVALKSKKRNELIIVSENHPLLFKKQVKLKSLHSINDNQKIPSNLQARIRHLGKLHKGKLIKKSNHYSFKFNKPVSSIASGQYIVLYSNQELIGSAIML